MAGEVATAAAAVAASRARCTMLFALRVVNPPRSPLNLGMIAPFTAGTATKINDASF